MKYLKQFLLILLVSLVGEILKAILPLPIPSSIYGMVLMFVLLLTGIIKLDQVKETGKFLIEIMPVMFIPAGVGLMSSWNVLQPVLVPVSIITVITIFTVMAATGSVSQIIIHKDQNDHKDLKEAA
ncbi:MULTISPECIES: CidA/LrgA family protein [unclassified Butyrivibrio]|uniref:CidA/LrgA family protein n=1 Tax=unclassified Butyrivibrio TaxID=2639466 RepID=UPI00047E275B|nr:MULTISPECIES: CidA/LrgA family protein [unclassified Butyrivibrio]